MDQYLIDTNAVSDYFSSSLSPAGIKFMDGVIDAIPKLGVITQIELLCWKTDTVTEQKVNDFISDSIVLSISTDVINECVAVRKGKKIKTPDAIIAATALAYSLILITNNEKDFSHISGLKIINPRKI